MYTESPYPPATVTTQSLRLRLVSLITTQLAVEVGLQTYRTHDNSTRFRHLVAELLTTCFRTHRDIQI
jgi:hypothetical protein